MSEEKEQASAQVQGQQKPQTKESKSSCLKASVIIIIIFVVLIGGYFGLAWVLRTVNEKYGSETTPSENSGGKDDTNIDKNLIGEWESECLTPDPNSPWAEKHYFKINSDGTATHIRWSSDQAFNCTSVSMTLTTEYTIKTPATGKIDFIDKESGATSYDIYQISGNTLLFGHGFRGDNLPYGTKFGGSESERIDTLNQFIVYTKKS